MDELLRKDREKLKLFKRSGYDIPKARKSVLSKAGLSGRILEVGTGKGHLAVALAKKGLKAVSIDADKKQIEAAAANLKAAGRMDLVTLKVMDAEKLSYKSGSFDAVISVNFLHHAESPKKCVKEMIRVTRDKLILADLNKKGERIMAKVHAKEGHSHPRAKISFKDLRLFLESSGMEVKTFKSTCETFLVAKKRGIK